MSKKQFVHRKPVCSIYMTGDGQLMVSGFELVQFAALWNTIPTDSPIPLEVTVTDPLLAGLEEAAKAIVARSDTAMPSSLSSPSVMVSGGRVPSARQVGTRGLLHRIATGQGPKRTALTNLARSLAAVAAKKKPTL